jgi:hypothetical protein
MHISLVVIPDFTTRFWEHRLDRQQELRLPRLEDAALRIDKRNANALEQKSRL